MRGRCGADNTKRRRFASGQVQQQELMARQPEEQEPDNLLHDLCLLQVRLRATYDQMISSGQNSCQKNVTRPRILLTVSGFCLDRGQPPTTVRGIGSLAVQFADSSRTELRLAS